MRPSPGKRLLLQLGTYLHPVVAIRLLWKWAGLQRQLRATGALGEYDRFEFYCEPDRSREAITAAYNKVGSALVLVEQLNPLLYRSLPKYVPRILLKSNDNTCAYVWWSAVCVLDFDMVESYPVEYIASVIVHEYAHGRIRGWRGGTPWAREKAESVCTNVQLKFLRRAAIAGYDVSWWIERLEERQALV